MAEFGVRTIRPADTVVVEGTLIVADRRLRARCDLTVYLDADDGTRLQRRLRRDVAERGLSEAFIVDQWRRFIAPMHRIHVEPCRSVCDLVLDENGPNASARRIVEAVVQRSHSRSGIASHPPRR
jgi:uridine kinase